MNIDGIPTRSLRAHSEQRVIAIIDQTRLPHALHWVRVATLEEAAHAIRAMQVRGAPLIGVTAAYGLALALDFEASDRRLAEAAALLRSTRPTAVNLHWAPCTILPNRSSGNQSSQVLMVVLVSSP